MTEHESLHIASLAVDDVVPPVARAYELQLCSGSTPLSELVVMFQPRYSASVTNSWRKALAWAILDVRRNLTKGPVYYDTTILEGPVKLRTFAKEYQLKGDSAERFRSLLEKVVEGEIGMPHDGQLPCHRELYDRVNDTDDKSDRILNCLELFILDNEPADELSFRYLLAQVVAEARCLREPVVLPSYTAAVRAVEDGKFSALDLFICREEVSNDDSKHPGGLYRPRLENAVWRIQLEHLCNEVAGV